MNLHLILASLTATLSLGIAAQAAPAKVACVGDSITFGTGLKPGETRYPQVLATLMGPDFDVRGFGNPGKTAGDYPGQAGRWYGSTRLGQRLIRQPPGSGKTDRRRSAQVQSQSL